MNSDTLAGTATDLGGTAKQAAGDATGNRALAGEGIGDQIGGTAQKALGAARDLLNGGAAPMIDQAKGFAKARPFATAALAGVVGLAILNTLRGRQ